MHTRLGGVSSYTHGGTWKSVLEVELFKFFIKEHFKKAFPICLFEFSLPGQHVFEQLKNVWYATKNREMFVR